jgi:hypothetical protein
MGLDFENLYGRNTIGNTGGEHIKHWKRGSHGGASNSFQRHKRQLLFSNLSNLLVTYT